MNIAELVKEYRDIRDHLDAARKTYMKIEKESKEKLFELETQMLDICRETGVESFRTPHGTAFKTLKTYARLGAGPEAKQARIDYAMKTGDFGLFTSHVNKTHSKELLDDGVNLAECGIDWIEEWSMSFRKPT
jgi:hypothetical protein